jgi:hypothetical protein
MVVMQWTTFIALGILDLSSRSSSGIGLVSVANEKGKVHYLLEHPSPLVISN